MRYQRNSSINPHSSVRIIVQSSWLYVARGHRSPFEQNGNSPQRRILVDYWLSAFEICHQYKQTPMILLAPIGT
jgi:hypothetical protein